MPPSLLLKLVVTPVLIAAASLAGRRWGDALSGWLVGLPFTSGPVLLFLSLEQGSHFAAAASQGVVLGVASQAVFGLAYVHLGGRWGWMAGTAAGTGAYAGLTALFEALKTPAALDPILALLVLVAAIAMTAAAKRSGAVHAAARVADLPLRIVIATALVIALTTVAPRLGPRLSGLISPVPLYAGILAAFAHRTGGLPAARAVWRGLFFGLFAFLAFFTVLGASLVPLGVAPSFALAIVAALAVQSGTLLALRLESRHPTPT